MEAFLPTASGGATLNPIALFVHADLVVKLVMLGLLAASVWTWMVIFSHGTRLSGLSKKNDEFERTFWKTDDVDRFHKEHSDNDLPSAKVFRAGVAEWRLSTGGRKLDRDGTRQRLNAVMASSIAAEMDKLSDRLNVLATIGSVAPFVGLFGTVWGIMRSFTDIAASQNTSLAVVAPGISEALFATAIGLFAAIPAVIAYNRLTHQLNKIEAKLTRFADGVHTTFSRELDGDA
ncbi:protein TolQ [Sphingomonas sp. ID0503]|uniref:protein TolQ n=1 Tax=Sphingomonas sp. ID0503 TaxID=3399691 RepID=UPI003AFAFEBA